MKKILFLVFFSFLILGCTTKKNIQKEYVEKDKVENIIKEYKDSIIKYREINKEFYSYKDSLIYVRGLLEKSSNIAEDSSYLETTYSKSFAKILNNGKLYHILINKDTIPIKKIIETKIVYKEEKENQNVVQRGDSISNKKNIKTTINEQKEVIVKNNIWNYIKGFFLGILFSILSMIIYFIYKKFFVKSL